MTSVAPRIANDVSCVTPINHESHSSWQAQYLVMLEDDFCCSAHCERRFMCDIDQSRESFFVAGAMFGDVGFCVTSINHESHFSWQAQYLVILEDGFLRAL